MTDAIAGTPEPNPPEPPTQFAEPGERECLRCYLTRVIARFGCDGTYRWTENWRDQRAPGAKALARRLARQGGYCDCEVVLNVYPDYPDVSEPIPCAGVPLAGSTMPCDLSGSQVSIRRRGHATMLRH